MSAELRPDLMAGRKLPEHALWEQLQRRAQPLALEFCSSFLNGEMSYKQARKWLEDYGIKISERALGTFFNSLDIRLRYASLQAAASAETAKAELPADIDKITRERIAQHKFELAFMNLGESQRLQLIQIQQSEDAMKGDYELKKRRLEIDREKLDLLKTKAAQLDQIKALRDPKAALNDEDRRAIVDKVDEVLGIKKK